MSWSEKFFDEVEVRAVVSRFPDSPQYSPSRKTAPFNSLRPRAGPDYFSLEDIVVFWCYGAYTKNIRYDIELTTGFAAISDHCPTPAAGAAGTVGRGHP